MKTHKHDLYKWRGAISTAILYIPGPSLVHLHIKDYILVGRCTYIYCTCTVCVVHVNDVLDLWLWPCTGCVLQDPQC